MDCIPQKWISRRRKFEMPANYSGKKNRYKNCVEAIFLKSITTLQSIRWQNIEHSYFFPANVVSDLYHGSTTWRWFGTTSRSDICSHNNCGEVPESILHTNGKNSRHRYIQGRCSCTISKYKLKIHSFCVSNIVLRKFLFVTKFIRKDDARL